MDGEKDKIWLHVRHLNHRGDQQQQVLLSEFEFPTNEIVILDEMVMRSYEELQETVEILDEKNVDVLIIPRMRGG